MSAQAYLTQSSAGMRLIALLTIYNQGDFDRLHGYIQNNYAPAALAEQAAENRVAELHTRYNELGKLRIEQVLGVGKYQAVVILQAQKDEQFYAMQVAVEEDFPHLITLHAWAEVEATTEDETANSDQPNE